MRVGGVYKDGCRRSLVRAGGLGVWACAGGMYVM